MQTKQFTFLKPAMLAMAMTLRQTVVGPFQRRRAVEYPIGSAEWCDVVARKIKNPVVQDITDIQPWMYYDRLSAAQGASPAQNLLFFTTPISSTKTQLDTNLQKAGELPNPKSFLCMALRFIFTDMFAPDIDLLVRSYYTVFKIGDKPYAEGHFDLYPGGAGIAGAMAGTFAATNVGSFASNGIADPNAVNSWGKDHGIHIGQGETFRVEGIAPTAVTLAASAAAAGGFSQQGRGMNLRCVMDGILYRQVQ